MTGWGSAYDVFSKSFSGKTWRLTCHHGDDVPFGTMAEGKCKMDDSLLSGS